MPRKRPEAPAFTRGEQSRKATRLKTKGVVPPQDPDRPPAFRSPGSRRLFGPHVLPTAIQSEHDWLVGAPALHPLPLRFSWGTTPC